MNSSSRYYPPVVFASQLKYGYTMAIAIATATTAYEKSVASLCTMPIVLLFALAFFCSNCCFQTTVVFL